MGGWMGKWMHVLMGRWVDGRQSGERKQKDRMPCNDSSAEH